MSTIDPALHLVEAAQLWVAIAATRRTVADEGGDSLESLGQMLAAAESLERAREKINEAIDLWGKAGLDSEHENVQQAEALAAKIDTAASDLDNSFGQACSRVVVGLADEGDLEELLEARELAALNHERLAAGKGLAELTDLLPGHGGCGCH
ncbi:MAG: hypothetical protein GY906_03210 [bacterium]|nr:hypothetical protein [bacterium]